MHTKVMYECVRHIVFNCDQFAFCKSLDFSKFTVKKNSYCKERVSGYQSL